jgi:hypothetical protein
MPHGIRGSPVLIVLAFAPLAFMVFWLPRIWFSRDFRTPAPAAIG